MNQTLQEYNQSENEYQMAFQTWSLDQTDENAGALSIAEQLQKRVRRSPIRMQRMPTKITRHRNRQHR